MRAQLIGVRKNVIGIEFFLPHTSGDRPRCRVHHLEIDIACAHVERAAEQPREHEHVIDLVGFFGRARADDRRPRRKRVLARNFGRGVGAGEHDGIFFHACDHLFRHTVGNRNADKHVGALHGVGKSARNAAAVGDLCQILFFAVQTGIALADNALAVAKDDFFDARIQQEARDGDARRPRAVDHDGKIFGFLAREFKSVPECRRRDDRRAVLVVVKDGNVELFFESALDCETARSRNIFEVDAAETAFEQLYRADNFFGIFGTDAERNGVDAAERLKQRALAFHNGHARLGADIAQSQHGGAVGNDGNGVPSARERKALFGIFFDRQTGLGNPRRVGERKFFARVDFHAGNDLDFTLPFGVLF